MRKLPLCGVLLLSFVVAADAFGQCPTTPMIVSPANGAQNVPTFTTLTWSNVGATLYDVYLGTQGACNGQPIATVTTTSFNPPQLSPGTAYEWKVIAKKAQCTPIPSACSTFTTQSCPTVAATPTAPSTNAQFPPGNVTFTWNTAPGATNYSLMLQKDGGGFIPQGTFSPTTTSATKTLAAGSYDWIIKTHYGQSCPTVDSISTPFSVSASNNCPTDIPLISQPSNGATFDQGTELTLKWFGVAGAQSYDILISTDEGQNFTTLATVVSPETFYMHTFAPGTYGWVVRANFPNNCASTRSSLSTFRIDRDCSTNAAPSLTFPEEEATIPLPLRFEWTAVSGATGYRVLAAPKGSTGTPVLIGSTNGDTNVLVHDLPAGESEWWVQAVFINCPPTSSEKRIVKTRTQNNCPSAPTLLSPSNGAADVNSPVIFRWTEVNNASAYGLFVSTGGDFVFAGSTRETAIERTVPLGATIRWYVVAGAPNCPEVRSSTFTFTTLRAACPAATIALNAPANNASTQSPVAFSWGAVDGAVAYRLWVAMNGGSPTILERTTSTSSTESLPAGNGVWYVEVMRAHCPTVTSERRVFTVQPRANCANNPAPSLGSPNGTQAGPTRLNVNNVTLQWNATPGAIGYRVWVARANQPFGDLGVTRETSVVRELPAGAYRWFVEAIFEGCAPVRSSTAFFNVETQRCANEAPSILTPAANATVPSPVTISWTGVLGAKEYRVHASLDGARPVTITTTETSITRPIPPGLVTFAVEAVFENCPSTFSPRQSFTVPQAQNCPTAGPVLVSPPNNAGGLGNDVEFVWNPLPGAVRYTLFVKPQHGVATQLGETTGTSLTRRVPPGIFEWWVTAFVNGCRPADSSHFHFGVAAPEGCDSRKPVLLEPANATRISGDFVFFSWSNVPRATGYRVWVARGDDEPSVVAATTTPEAKVELKMDGVYRWFVEALFSNCPPERSARAFFVVSNNAMPCFTPPAPRANVVAQAISGTEYKVRWSPLPLVNAYELQESTSAEFTTATTLTVNGISAEFRHDVTTPTTYYYRVRGISECTDAPGAYSDVVSVIIMPARQTTAQRHATAEVGVEGQIVQTIFLPGEATPQAFSATVDKPWLRVVPSSGVVPPAGLTLSIIADPAALDLGTNTATVSIVYAAGAGRITTHATNAKLPVSVSLVTPITPAGKGTPPPDALIIPAVVHSAGANDSLFESDIRITNLGAETMKYLVTFTPSATEGTTSSSSANLEVAPNETTALDDIVATLFGSGTTVGSLGMLEIRPLTTTGAQTSFVSTASQVTTVASSRTYNVTPTGTFGQFIPAIPFEKFAGVGAVLSLQQIAQSTAYRTNFGFAEGSGNPADLLIKVYDTRNVLVKEIRESLRASEHKQINQMLALHGITNLADGRVTVEVTGGLGKVTAYASTVDNQTSDPLLVSPVLASSINANRFIVPGVATINTGFANWRTDMRVFNSGSISMPATITFYPQGNPTASVTKNITLGPGEIRVLDNVLATEFAQPNGAGGQIVVATANNAPIVVTARTYNQTSTGTFGQFIPGVTPAEAIGVDERPLQILQLEQSSRFRTNIGLSETTGNPATVEVSVLLPDSKASPFRSYNLRANEFLQVSLADFGVGDAAYNVRVSVKVTGGTGRVTAYGSAIDATTQDPTYVPAQ